MQTRTTLVIALGCLLARAAYSADDPFCGKWKFNTEKSKVTGQQLKIEDLGGARYKFTSGNDSDVVKADGSDQPIHYGNTMVLSKEGPHALKMIIKRDGKVLSSMTHTLTDDGSTQTIKGTAQKPDGTTSDFEFVDKRVGGGSGWTGTWESTDAKFNAPDLWEISEYQNGGLTFYDAAYKDTLSMNFDGKDYAEKGPTVAEGSTSSGKRVDAHTLDVTDKIKGEVMDQTKFEVSPDGNTLTLTIHNTGQPNPTTVVYDKAH